MSKEEPKLTQAMIDRIGVVERARARAAVEKQLCADAGLFVYARMWDHIYKSIEQDSAMQLRVLKGDVPDGFVHSPKPEVVDSPASAEEPNPARERRLEFE